MNKEFDKIVRQKLENIEQPFQKAHWEQFEQSYGEELGADSNSLDELARQQLGGLESSFSQQHWDLFEKQLDRAEAGEADQLYRKKMNDLEVPYDPSHWDLMAAHIDHVFTLGRTILHYKLSEIALMILLFLLVFQRLPLTGVADPGQDKDNPAIAQTTPGHSTDLAEKAGLPVLPQQEIENATSYMQADADLERTPFLAGEKHEDASSAISASDRSFMPLEKLPSIVSGSISIGKEAQMSSALTDFAHKHEKAKLLAGITHIDSKVRGEEKRKWTPPIIPVDERMLKSAFSQDAHFAAAPLPSSVSGIPAHTHLRVGLFGGVEYNYVKLPYDDIFKIGPRSIDSVGHSVGFSLALQFGRFEIETGGQFSRRSYRPLLPTQQFGTFDYIIIETYEHSRFDFFELPLAANYRLWRPGSRWNGYLRGGFIGKVLVNSAYEIEQKEVYTFSNSQAPSEEDRRTISAKSKLNQKRFPEGVAESGSLEDNTYLSATLGLGVEYLLSHRFSVYFQPSYQYPLLPNDFGPNNERIHTVSFRFGSRFNIW